MDAIPRPKGAKAGATRARVLEAALGLLAREGAQGLSLAAAAREAGVTRGCVQFYFMTRSELLAGLAACAAERLVEAMEARAAEPPTGPARGAFAAELFAGAPEPECRLVLLELTVASRSDQELRRAVEAGFSRIEAAERRIVGALSGDPALADTPALRAGLDLARLVNLVLPLLTPGESGESGRSELSHRLPVAIQAMWRGEETSPGAGGKPRVRVRAGA
ncbi:MAG: TetR/AcrR family transcriptional regulator [Caulobacteraceae bacterium]